MGRFCFSLLITIISFCSASGQSWTPLGTGMNDQVTALTVFNSELYASGKFSTAGGNSANRVAKWNGTSWTPLGTGFSWSEIYSLAVYNNELYASYYGSTIYKWNGTAWTGAATLGNPASRVTAMAVYNGELYTAGELEINRFNGINWSLPVNVGGTVSSAWPDVASFAVYNGELYAGGSFSSINGVSANNIAKWNGTSWTALGTGVTGINPPRVSALAVYGGELYAAGDFASAGGITSPSIAKWNGTSWSAVGNGITLGSVSALQVFNGNLYAGGLFTTSPPYSVQNMAVWNGTTWMPSGIGVNNRVRALADFNGQLVAGGNFTMSGSSALNYIAGFTQCVAAPAAPGIISGSGNVCSGTTQVYSVTGTPGVGYSWSLPPGWSGSSTANLISSVPSTGNGIITVAAVNACGTSAMSTLPVVVDPTPTAIVTASGPLSFCQGGSVTLTTPNLAGNTYQWINYAVPIAGATSNSYAAVASGLYSVKVTTGPCSANSAFSSVAVLPLPVTPTIVVNGNVLLATAGFASYQWHLNGSPIANANSSTYSATQSGSYYVIVTETNGCSVQSAQIAFTLVGVNDPSAASSIQIFPNPADGVFTIRSQDRHLIGNIIIEVKDVLGKIVHMETATSTSMAAGKSINLMWLSAGIYAVSVISPESISVHSIYKR